MILKALRFAIPIFYIPLFIIAPILLLNTDYGWSIVIVFWIPSILLYLFLQRWMGAVFRKAFWITSAIIALVTFGFEYVALAMDIWNFSEHIHKLWGINVIGVPVEEFIFWFGATPVCLLVYLYYYRLFKGQDHE
jgi:lycopene cyclase domain-containing protein